MENRDLSLLHFRFHFEPKSPPYARVQQGQCDSGRVWEYVSADVYHANCRDGAREPENRVGNRRRVG